MAAKYSVHPFCELFPDLSEPEYEALKADIAEHGVRDPIWAWGNKIVEGRHRWFISQELKIDCPVREWKPPGNARNGNQQEAALLAFVVSKNLHRRHLTQSQRAAVAAEISSEKQRLSGQNVTNVTSPKITQEQAAAALGVSRMDVNQAAKVLDEGTPTLAEAVKSGDVSVRDAAAIVTQPAAVQNAAVKAVKSGKSKTVRAAVPEKPADDATPFDEHLLHCDSVLKSYVPNSQTYAIDIERQLGKAKGEFSAKAIERAMATVHKQFEGVRRILLNAQARHRRKAS